MNWLWAVRVVKSAKSKEYSTLASRWLILVLLKNFYVWKFWFFRVEVYFWTGKFFNESILRRFNMENCFAIRTPMEKGLIWLILTKPMSFGIHRYSIESSFGYLMYLSNASRSYICYATNYINHFQLCYMELHFKHAKKILPYLRGTSSRGICFRRKTKRILC